jgi:hypothetical protein
MAISEGGEDQRTGKLSAVNYRTGGELGHLAMLGFWLPGKEPQREKDRNKSGNNSH